MTERQVWSAGAVAALVLLAWLAGPWTPLKRALSGPGGNVQLGTPGDTGGGVTGYQGLGWDGSRPWPYRARGGLFHPPACGEGRTGLINWGWDWIAYPPGEAEQLTLSAR